MDKPNKAMRRDLKARTDGTDGFIEDILQTLLRKGRTF